ncbi:uncharacterized protein LOC118644709 [Monomorium pharaonis]|uniref:uncharacterized protein LOC118644709 n=1 Tax=Monomorium pharaonis TaxID=307658 RepID=UPI001745C71C|nr:uncharacterized protein LOC118644709 [Monomorium pharaonis]XP_036139741.1 uncharacterized protein LOC118644709 [Monomorium pharaonis]
MGDFNAHHQAWICEDTDGNGEALLNNMYNNYICLNYDTKSRLNRPDERGTNIDLIFINPYLIDETTYNQGQDTWGSDHFPIVLNLKIDKSQYRKVFNRLSSKSTDWHKYKKEVEKKIKEIVMFGIKDNTKQEEINNKNNAITEIMRQGVIKATESLKRANKKNTKQKDNNKTIKNPNKWWDAECKEVIKTRKEKLQEYRKKQNLQTYIEYKSSVARAIRKIKEKKTEAFTNFCNSINRWTGVTYVWNTMKILKNRFAKVSWNTWKTKDRKEVILKEINKITLLEKERNQEINGIEKMERVEDLPLNDKFTMDELERALGMTKRNSAPGRDKIDYVMIKELRGEIIYVGTI